MQRTTSPRRVALVPDAATFAGRWPGTVLVTVVLAAVPTAFLLRSIVGGTYIDDSWLAVLAAIVVVTTYAISRRLLATLLVTAIVLSAATFAAAPRLSTEETGDAALLARLETARQDGRLEGYRDLAITVIDADSPVPVRLAALGIDESTPVEIGSVTKAMTGLVIADAVERGEIRLEAAVSEYLPQLADSPAGEVSMRELVTHTAGYVAFGPDTVGRGFWAAPLGRNFFATEFSYLIDEARSATLDTRGTYVYSTLGAAIAGLAVAEAADMSYPELMRERLFEPLGMRDTAVADEHHAVAGGWSASGLPVQPWVMGSYAPGGGVISTAHDLATFATALLRGTAPGLAAMQPLAHTATDGTRVGMFWHISDETAGQTVTWHTGQTGGYTSYLGLDLVNRTAVIILSDVSNPDVAALGRDLLSDRA